VSDPPALPPLDIRTLLRRYDLRPDSRLGQNFLEDEAALRTIVDSAEILGGETVLEIGPGLGSLTRRLAQKAQRVVAVELDERLLPALEAVLSSFDNVRLVQGDILELNPADLAPAQDYPVVANIPYYITSALIRHLLEGERPPDRIVLTIQREVAERICAEPGDMSLLSLSVQVYGQPRIVARIPARAFYPVPKVDSSVVRIDLYDHPQVPEPSLEIFFRLIKAGFSQKRKNLRNSLSGGMRWEKDFTVRLLKACDIDPRWRAQRLSLDDWRRLAEELASTNA
jgi:16S rRNA (adenine1518-N6/adenine1519-N6)-dimethyltransferase